MPKRGKRLQSLCCIPLLLRQKPSFFMPLLWLERVFDGIKNTLYLLVLSHF